MPRALIFSGRNNHEWRATTPAIRALLEREAKMDVRVEEEPAGTTAATLAPYDVLVLDYNGARWGAATEAAVAAFVREGQGLLVVHGAAWAFHGLDVLGDNHKRMGIFEPPWEEYMRMIGGGWTEEEPKTGHGKRHAFKVKLTVPEHPALRGLPAALNADDELYHGYRFQRGVDMQVLATAFDAPEIGGTGRDEPVYWTVNHGRGRVFHITLGHDARAMAMPAFAWVLPRAALWLAGHGRGPRQSGQKSASLEVSLPAPFHQRGPSE